jgi:hypothetical protein
MDWTPSETNPYPGLPRAVTSAWSGVPKSLVAVSTVAPIPGMVTASRVTPARGWEASGLVVCRPVGLQRNLRIN